MAENLGSAVLRLSTDNTGLTRGLAKGEKQSKAAMGRMASALATHRKAIGVGMLAVGAAITGVGLVAINSARAFETSFAGVRKTVDATEEQFDELAAGFRRLSKEIPVNVNELNRIGEAAGQLGIKRENIIAFTETIAKLGVTTNLTGEEAATALARIANITGLAQDEFSNMGSAIVALGNNLATTEAEILTFALRIAGAGTIAGLTETDLLAIGGAMTSVGIQAEAGGTAVQKVLLGINQAVIQGGAKLATFAKTSGLSAEEFGKVWEEDAGEAFNLFVEGLAREGDNAVNVLAELDLTDQRLVRAFLSLANAGDLLRDSIDLSSDAFKENTALTKEAEERFKTFDSRLQLVKNQMGDLSISIGMVLLPVVSSLIAKVLPLIDSIGTWIEEHQTLTKIIAIAVLGLGALLLVFGAILLVLPGLIAGMVLLAGASGIGLVILATTAIVAAITFLVVKWDFVWNEIKKITETVGNFIVDLFNKMTLVQRTFISTMLEGLKTVLNVASKIPGVGDKFKGMAAAIQIAIDRVKEGVPNFELMSDAVVTVGESASATAEEMKGLSDTIATSTASAVNSFEEFGDASETLAERVKQDLEDQVDATQKANEALVKHMLDNVEQREKTAKLIRGVELEALQTAQDVAKKEIEAREAVGKTWDRFNLSLDATIREMTENSLSFGDVIGLLAVDMGISTRQMTDDLAEMGVEFGDVMGLIGEVGRETVDGVVSEFVRLAAQAANAIRLMKKQAGGGGGGRRGGAGGGGVDNRSLASIAAAGVAAANRAGIFLSPNELANINAIVERNGTRADLVALQGLVGQIFSGELVGLIGSFKHGGMVPGLSGEPLLAVLHGKETVIPEGGMGGPTIIFQGDVFGFEDFERRVASIAVRQQRRGAA